MGKVQDPALADVNRERLTSNSAVGTACALVFCGFVYGGASTSWSWLWTTVAYLTAVNSLWWVLHRVQHGVRDVEGEASADGVLWIANAVPGAVLASLAQFLPEDGRASLATAALVVATAVAGVVVVQLLRLEWEDQESYIRSNPDINGGRAWKTWSSLFIGDIAFSTSSKATYTRDSISTLYVVLAVAGLSVSSWLFTFTEYRDHRFAESLVQVIMVGVYGSLFIRLVRGTLRLRESGGGNSGDEEMFRGKVFLNPDRGDPLGTGQPWKPLPREKTGMIYVMALTGALGAVGPIVVLLAY